MAVSLAVIGLLLLAEPDMGAFIVIATIALGILFLGGVNGKMFTLSFAVLVGAFGLMIALSPFRRERILAFLDPWNPVYAQGKGYQLTHSLIAFGRGEITGQGLGASVEKLHYLPEAHTDFLMAVIGEELGFVGVAWRPITKMRRVSQKKAKMTQATPTKPSSSPITAIRKSVWASGR